jgi:cobalt/nickel transport system ATP-binding protein
MARSGERGQPKGAKPSSKALECRQVTVRRRPDSDPTLSDLTFSMEQGERVALVGLNGTGKTTLLMSLVGLLRHEGEISIAGRLLSPRNVAECRRDVGFLFNVPEDQLLFPTVMEDVAFGLMQSGVDRKEATQEALRALEQLGSAHLAELSVHHLSHGQKQRVALAGAIVAAPSLLLLDEPTAALDPPGKVELASLLSELDSAQLIATHDLDFADRTCSRVLLLEESTITMQCKDTGPVRERWAVVENPAPDSAVRR